METRELKAGTVVHIHGIPVTLKTDAEFETAEGNWRVIDETPLPAPSDQASSQTEFT